MELEPLPQLQSKLQEALHLPELEKPKGKVNLKYSPSGELSIETDSLSDSQAKEFTDFILAINADNILRQRAVQQVCKDSSDIFNHLIAFTLCSGITLFGVCTVSKVFQSQPQVGYGNQTQLQQKLNT